MNHNKKANQNLEFLIGFLSSKSYELLIGESNAQFF